MDHIKNPCAVHKVMERIDWNRLWEEDNEDKDRDRSSKYWDDFAPRFRKDLPEGSRDEYVEQFYDYSGFQDGETIFDMGCGSGTLAIPYARRGHEIWAADFSTVMLDHLMDGARREGLEKLIHPIALDWNEDWSIRKDLKKCDVAISSRSFMPASLTDGIRKLESVAKKRVCIGAWDTPAEGYIRELARAIGYERPGYGCYIFIMGELMDRDLRPCLKWINNPFRKSRYESWESANEILKESFQYGLTEDQEKAVDAYLKEHLNLVKGDGEEYWQMDIPRTSTIAHISWEIK